MKSTYTILDEAFPADPVFGILARKKTALVTIIDEHGNRSETRYGVVTPDEIYAMIDAKEEINLNKCYIEDFSLTKYISSRMIGNELVELPIFKAIYSWWHGDTNFNYATFTGDVNFNSSIFNGITNFTSITFGNNTDFSNVEFRGSTLFWYSKFNGTIDFTCSVFNNDASFEKVEFSADATFSNVIYNGAAKYNSAVFNVGAFFSQATFHNRADFSKVSFNEYTTFSLATFKENANFSSISFRGVTVLSLVTFNKNADFSFVIFSKNADFSSTTFNDYVSFKSATFMDVANFNPYLPHGKPVQFNHGVVFDSVQFDKTARFDEIVVNDKITFNSAIFKGAAVFDSAYIESAKFTNTFFQYPVNFIRTTINELDLTSTVFATYAVFNHSNITSSDAYARETYRTIKHELIKINNRLDSAEYQRKEMDAYRIELKKEGWYKHKLEKFVLFFNRISNVYGTSLGRAIWFTFIVSGLFFGIYVNFGLQNTCIQWEWYSWEGFYKASVWTVKYMTQYMFIGHNFDFMGKEYPLKDCGYALDAIGRLFIGYAYFQIYQALRKFKIS